MEKSEICALWNETVVPSGGIYAEPMAVDSEQLAARVLEAKILQPGVSVRIVTAEDWRTFFRYITASPTLMGAGVNDWRISLYWLVRSPEKFRQVRVGRYHQEVSATP